MGTTVAIRLYSLTKSNKEGVSPGVGMLLSLSYTTLPHASAPQARSQRTIESGSSGLP